MGILVGFMRTNIFFKLALNGFVLQSAKCYWQNKNRSYMKLKWKRIISIWYLWPNLWEYPYQNSGFTNFKCDYLEDSNLIFLHKSGGPAKKLRHVNGLFFSNTKAINKFELTASRKIPIPNLVALSCSVQVLFTQIKN